MLNVGYSRFLFQEWSPTLTVRFGSMTLHVHDCMMRTKYLLHVNSRLVFGLHIFHFTKLFSAFEDLELSQSCCDNHSTKSGKVPINLSITDNPEVKFEVKKYLGCKYTLLPT
jgi:hypothetical protein